MTAAALAPGAADTFSAPGGPHGVLLLHGFGGTPASMRPWAQYLAARGYAVSVPLLPGHGTRWEDMAGFRWIDWYAQVDAALLELAARSERVTVAGLSMGGTLAMRLAIERGDDVAGLLLVNPGIASAKRMMSLVPLLQHVIPSVANSGEPVRKPGVPRVSYDRISLKAVRQMMLLWRDVRGRLGEVGQPVLLFRSSGDGASGEASRDIIFGGIRSPDRREVVLENSNHIATLDNDAELIFEESLRFLGAHARVR